VNEEYLWRFLKFHRGVINRTKMPYLRDMVALDFLKDILKMTYDDAEKFLESVRIAGFIDFDQHGAFPGTILTAAGEQKLKELEKKFEGVDYSIDIPIPKINIPAEKLTLIWGPSKHMEEIDTSEIAITEDQLLQFLSFVAGVCRNMDSHYLRELVAEDFLIDKLGLPYEKTDRFLHELLDREIIEYEQFGAFPGFELTEKGKEILEALRNKKNRV
jgi:RIO-like serine/threonine protein kinase